ncbi:MAG TPA: hypothetical protein VGM93_13160 [Acidimicrobiales bacterium]
MIESSDRVDEFKAEIAGMKLAEPALARERLLLRLGAALLVVGPVVAIYAYFLSHGTTNALQQNDAVTVGLLAVALTLAGAVLFLRYSLAGFLRFWMARLTYEQKAQTDRLLAKDAPPE